jgi:hypothetical protein
LKNDRSVLLPCEAASHARFGFAPRWSAMPRRALER